MSLTVKVGSKIDFSLPSGVSVSSTNTSVIDPSISGGVCTLLAKSPGSCRLSAHYSDLFGGFDVVVVP